MQIWEAETLHMSQLAGGWDFLTLSDWRCASKTINCITSNGAVAGRLCAAVDDRGARRDRQIKGQKKLTKTPQKQQYPPGQLQKWVPPVPLLSARWIARSKGTASAAY